MAESAFVSDSVQIPSTVVERYLARTSHENGLVFEMAFDFDGLLDMPRMRRATQNALRHHVRSHYRWIGRGSRQRWQAENVDAENHFFQYAPGEEESAWPEISSGNGILIRAICDVENQTTRLRFLFHHACVDGVGATRVIGSVFRCYAEDADAFADQKESTSSGDTLKDESPASADKRVIPDWRNTYATVRGSNVRLRKHFAPDRPTEQVDPNSCSVVRRLPDTVVIRFKGEVSKDMRQTLRTSRIAINDFAVAVSLFVLGKLTQPAPGRFVNVMNPDQLRGFGGRHQSQNHLGFSYVRREHDQLGDLHETLASVTSELVGLRENNVTHELAWGLGALEKVPGALSLIERIGWFTPTASMTCMSSARYTRRSGFTAGRKLGGIELTSIYGAAPIQAGGEMAITLWDTGRQIALSFRSADWLMKRLRRDGEQLPFDEIVAHQWAIAALALIAKIKTSKAV